MIGVAHRLAPAHRAPTPLDVARSLVGLHSTDPASVPLAIAARTTGPGAPVAAVDAALYDDRSIVRVMGMRRTIWAVPVELVEVVAAACGRSIAANERRTLVKLLEGNDVTSDAEGWLRDVETEALAAIAERGAALTTEITKDVPLLKGTVTVGGTAKWAAQVGIGSRLVLVLASEGRIVRGRPRGGWTSNQYRWSVAPAAGEPMSTADAQAELARRWLAAFGGASVDHLADLRWWAGWTVAATKQALAAAGEVEPVVEDAGPWAALVPALDPTTMGWKQRDWYLGDLGPQLFDGNGNAGPTVWWSDRIVGGWAQRATGEVAVRLLVDVGREGTAVVDAEAARLQAWLDGAGAVVRPRFPTPLLKELCV